MNIRRDGGVRREEKKKWGRGQEGRDLISRFCHFFICQDRGLTIYISHILTRSSASSMAHMPSSALEEDHWANAKYVHSCYADE